LKKGEDKMSNSDKVSKKAKALKKVREAEEALATAKLEARVATEEDEIASKKKALATAKLKARVATEEDEIASKKKPLISEVVEIAEVKKETVVGTDADKKQVLDFLQKKAWDLRKAIHGLIDLHYEDDPPRVIASVVSSEVKIPKLEHNGVEIAVEIEVRAAIPAGTVSLGEDGSEDSVYHRSIAGDGAKALGIKDALGPHSVSNGEGANKREAYEAWLKRHRAVKRS
jgi:hypothetical protein